MLTANRVARLPPEYCRARRTSSYFRFLMPFEAPRHRASLRSSPRASPLKALHLRRARDAMIVVAAKSAADAMQIPSLLAHAVISPRARQK